MAFARAAATASRFLDLRHGWALLASCFFLELLAGSPYSLPLYSADIKTTLNLHQSDYETLVALGNLGLYLSMPGGFFMDRFGYARGGMVGCMFLASGSALGVFVLTNLAPQHGEACSSSTYGLYALSIMLSFQGCGWIDAVAMGSAVGIFSESRGTAVGVLKSFFGLGAGVYAQILVALQLGQHPAVGVLSMLGVGCVTVGTVACVVITMTTEERRAAEAEAEAEHAQAVASQHRHPLNNAAEDKPRNQRRFAIAYLLVILLAVDLSITSFIRQMETTSASPWLSAPAMVLLVALCGLAIRHKASPARDSLAVTLTRSDDQWNESIRRPADEIEMVALETRDWTACEALRSVDYWLFLLANFCGMGSGLMLLFNLAQMTRAVVGVDDSAERIEVQDLVVMASVANACGRMAAGLTSDVFSHKINRPWFFSLWLAVVGIGCAVLSSGSKALLFPGFIIALLGYGGLWAMTPVMCRELFGATNFGSIYTTIAIAPAAGSAVYNSVMVSYFYKAALGPSPASNTCIGVDCYRPSLIISAGSCVVASLLGAVLAYRSRRLYNFVPTGEVTALQPVA